MGSTNLSTLVSKGSELTISFPTNFEEMDSILSNHVSSTPNVARKQIGNNNVSNDETMTNLMQESIIQYQIMYQTSKALHFCQKTKEFSSSVELVEAERLLLLSSKCRSIYIARCKKTPNFFK